MYVFYVVFVWGALVSRADVLYHTKSQCEAVAHEWTAYHAGSAGSLESVYAYCMTARAP